MITTTITLTKEADVLKDIGISKPEFDKWAREVMLALQSSNIRRIHNNGEAVDGSSIGKYGTKPMYVNPNKSPVKFQPKGKKGKTVFNNGKPHKTAYFEEGYKGFRAKIGRETGVVNLQLSGKLKEDFRIESTSNEWSLGFPSEYGEKLHEGLEKKYGKTIWGVSSDDERVIDAITERYAQH